MILKNLFLILILLYDLKGDYALKNLHKDESTFILCTYSSNEEDYKLFITGLISYAPGLDSDYYTIEVNIIRRLLGSIEDVFSKKKVSEQNLSEKPKTEIEIEPFKRTTFDLEKVFEDFFEAFSGEKIINLKDKDKGKDSNNKEDEKKEKLKLSIIFTNKKEIEFIKINENFKTKKENLIKFDSNCLFPLTEFNLIEEVKKWHEKEKDKTLINVVYSLDKIFQFALILMNKKYMEEGFGNEKEISSKNKNTNLKTDGENSESGLIGLEALNENLNDSENSEEKDFNAFLKKNENRKFDLYEKVKSKKEKIERLKYLFLRLIIIFSVILIFLFAIQFDLTKNFTKILEYVNEDKEIDFDSEKVKVE